MVYGYDHPCVGEAVFYGGLIMINKSKTFQEMMRYDKLLTNGLDHLMVGARGGRPRREGQPG